MQSAEQLISRIKEIIKDNSFSDAFILEKINDALAAISISTKPPGLIVNDKEIIISPGDTSAILPENFFGPRLLMAYNDTDRVYCSISHRVSEFPMHGDSGSLRHICLKGREILLADSPKISTSLLVSYMSVPIFFEGVTDSGDDIIYLPSRLGESAVVNHVATNLFSHIEDGIDGKSVNTSKMLSFYEKDLLDIVNFFGIEAQESFPETVVDMSGVSSYRSIIGKSWGTF